MLALALAALAAAAPHHRYDAEVARAVQQTAAVYQVPPALVRAVIRQESAFRPTALSRTGARGLMQLMPRTAAAVGVSPDSLWDPSQNILAGVRYLAVLLSHYKGDLISVLAAYNARPRRLFAPLPANGETPLYVLKVLGHYEQYQREERGLISAEARR
jgi:soluble lytic murein transglycosylase-like protein